MINNLNINEFLTRYWQKKPILIRNAFPGFQSPVSAEELAGLACEDFIESRIISEHKQAPVWQLENGPFAESRFSELPGSHWTLLIQGLNKIFPEFDDLLHEFDFIPSWRVDDLMASYAVTGGSVGPHIDQYDVFLLQASGKRKWMLNEQPVCEEDLEPGLPLKIIRNFKTETEWVLEPGDMLYLPPNVAHYGVALDDCMTFSIGFRAPSHAEIISAYVDDRLATLNDELRYQDADLVFSRNNGEISGQAINKVYDIMQTYFADKAGIEDWFGKFITEYHHTDEEIAEDNITPVEIVKKLKLNNDLRRPASVRANYIIKSNGQLHLYINGNNYPVKSDIEGIARLFCDSHILKYEDIKRFLENDNATKFITGLHNNGYLEIDNPDA